MAFLQCINLSSLMKVRLLTVGRQVKTGVAAGEEADNNFVCLSLCLSARDKVRLSYPTVKPDDHMTMTT